MGRRRRYHIPRLVWHAVTEELVAEFGPRLEACPEAATYPDEEVEDFLNAAQYLDYMHDAPELVADLRKRRISFPLDLSFDLYRLGRHLLHRWQEPGLRGALLKGEMYMEMGRKPKMTRLDGEVMRRWVTRHGVPAVRSMIRNCDLEHVLPELEAALTPELQERCAALMLFGRVQLHWYLTQPEPARRQSAWEQRKLARHLRLREVQLHAMNRSLHHLRRERATLISRLRELSSVSSPELDRLLADSERIRAERAAADSRHADALAAQAARYRVKVAAGKQELEQNRRDYGLTLQLRGAWVRTGRRGRP